MTHTKSLSAEDTKLKNNAFPIAATNLGASVITLVFSTLLALQLKSWQGYALVALVLLPGVLAFNSLRQIRNRRIETGMWQLIIGNMILWPLGTLLVAGAGMIVGLTVVIGTYFCARLTLSAKDFRRVLIGSLGVGALTAATDLLPLEFRLQVPAIQTYASIITGIALLLFGSFIARDVWARSLRNKLMVVFIGSTVITAGILSVYLFTTTTNTLRQKLEREFEQHTDSIARQISALFNEQITSLTTLSLNETLQKAASDANNSYEGDASAVDAILKARDAQWQAADAADNNTDPLVFQLLHTPASQELIKFQNIFPDHVEVFITDRNGGLVAATARTSDYYQADEVWWKVAYNSGQGALYISEPKYDQSADAFGVQIALPIRDQKTNQVLGIMRTTFQTASLTPILGELIGETGETVLYIPGRPAFIFHQGQLDPMDPDLLNELQALIGQGMVEIGYQQEGTTTNSPLTTVKTPSIVLQTSMKDLQQDSAFNELGWVVLYHQSQDEAYAPISASVRGAIIVIAIAVFLAVAGAYALSLLLVRPITQLTQAAEEVASGNLGSRARVTSTDEVGILASTFNSMTSQLQETLQGLEQRIADRTRDLATVAEVGTATATILESKRLLQEVVNLTKERFNLYHSHIYLLDEKGENLVLASGAGEPGRIMVTEGRSIPLSREQSLVARAARERKGVSVNDVTQAPDFLPNPLLPDTRSELAVPMIVGEKVIGVFDIQSEQVGRFGDSDVNIQTTLASQLATSIQNVRSFEQSKKQADFEAQVNLIGQKIQRTTTIEETLQTAIREMGNAASVSRATVQLGNSGKTGHNNNGLA